MIENPDEVSEAADDQNAIFRRFFALAVQRAGSPWALAGFLGIPQLELQRYAVGASIPPNHIVLRTVDWMIERHVARSRTH